MSAQVPKKAKDREAAWGMQDMQDNKPHGWVQWKGTKVCMDVHCKCGNHGHIDAEFAYFVKCENCGTVYMLNGHIEFIELETEPENCVVLVEKEDE